MRTLYYQQFSDGIPVVIRENHHSTVPRHKHSFFEFVYVTSGSADHVLENKRAKVSEGDFFLINLNSSHEYSSLEDSPDFSVINILFLPEFLDPSLKGASCFQEILDNYLMRYGYDPLGELPTQKIFHDDTGMVRMLAESAYREYGEKRTGFTDIIRNHLHSLIIHLVREETAHFSDGRDVTVSRIKHYIAEHYMDSLRLSDICERMGFSLSYISALFRERVGMTFREYLLKIRLEKAGQLLMSSDMTVQRISTLVGYADPAFFYKAFRRMYGGTPEEFRASRTSSV